MQKTYVLLALVLLSFFPEHIFAATAVDNLPDTILTDFKKISIEMWMTNTIGIAKILFSTLLLFDLVFVLGTVAIKSGDIGDILGELLRIILFAGFGLTIIAKPTWLFDIVQGFRDVATAAGGGTQVHPSNFFDIALKLMAKAFKFNIFSGPKFIGSAIVTLVIFLCIAFLTAFMIVAIIESYVVIFGGVVLLGFLGSRYTKEYGLRYLGYTISVGCKVMVIQLLAGVAFKKLSEYYAVAETSLPDLAALAGFSLILVVLVIMVPQTIQSMISGVAGTGGTGTIVKGITTAAGVAGAAASGGAGAAMAVSEAAKLSSEKFGSGEGGFATNLAKSFAQDLSGKIRGDSTTRSGSIGGRMASRMAAQREGSRLGPRSTARGSDNSSTTQSGNITSED